MDMIKARHNMPSTLRKGIWCQEWGLVAITNLNKDRTMAKIFGRGLEPRDQ
jgi:hypothetical protein